MKETTEYKGPKPRLNGFLSNHESPEKVVSITTEPATIRTVSVNCINFVTAKGDFNLRQRSMREQSLTLIISNVVLRVTVDSP